MAEEIRIRIVPEVVGTALQDTARTVAAMERNGTGAGSPQQDPQARIAQLRKAAEVYEGKGWTEMAQSARREASGIEAELRRKAKESANAEKQQTQQSDVSERRELYSNSLRAMELRASGNKKEAEQLERSNAIRLRAIQLERQLAVDRATAVNLATREVDALAKERSGGGGFLSGFRGGGGGRLGGMMSLLGIGSGATGAIGTGLFAQNYITNEANSLLDLTQGTRDAGVRFTQGERHAKRQMGAAADAGEWDAIIQQRKDEIDSAKIESEHLQTEIEKNKSAQKTRQLTWTIGGVAAGAMAGAATGAAGTAWSGPGAAVGAIGGLLIGGGAALLKNKQVEDPKAAELQTQRDLKDAEIANRERQLAEAKAKKTQALEREVGITEKLAAGKMVEARAEQMALEWHKKYRELRTKAGDDPKADAIARRGADAQFQSELRQHEQALGGLISARTGAAAAARIAGLGDRQFEQAKAAVDLQRSMEGLRGDMNQNHQQATATAGLKSSSRPSLSVRP